MQLTQRPARGFARRLLAPALGLGALALTAQIALAVNQPKPEFNVETERSPQGAKLTFKGKNWAPNARIKITGTRAPGASAAQDFGMHSADEKGELNVRKVVGCSTDNEDVANSEQVTFTATDSATSAKLTKRVAGGAWVCP